MALLGPAAMSAGTAAIYTRLNVLRADLDEGTSSSDESDEEGEGAIQVKHKRNTRLEK